MTVNILGIAYTVKRVPFISRERYVLGDIDHEHQVISLVDTLLPDQAQQVFIHEILHGIFQQTGMHHYANDEQLVGCLANALNQFLQDNPDALKGGDLYV